MHISPKDEQFMQAGHKSGHNVSLKKYRRICIGRDHTRSIFLEGTKFVTSKQQASNTKDSFRKEKQDRGTLPNR